MRHLRRMQSVELAAACVVLLLASCKTKDANKDLFACKTSKECGSGWSCVASVCRLAGVELDAGPQCATPCGPDRKACCGGACADLAADRAHCGSCGHECPGSESCLGGVCLKETTGAGSCANGMDDDGDGLTDCTDTVDCTEGTTCRGGQCCHGSCAIESSADLCSNHVDDDCNGLADCDDPACNNQRCGPGSVCSNGHCEAGCAIDGVFVAAGALHPSNPCLQCTPARGTTGWSAVDALVACTSGACDGHGDCRRGPGKACAGPGDCASRTCTSGRCGP